MKHYILGALTLILGRLINGNFYQNYSWAGDWLHVGPVRYGMVLWGYAASWGDILQWLGVALCYAIFLCQIVKEVTHLENDKKATSATR